MKRSLLQTSQKILVVKLAGIGDFVLAFPALKCLSVQSRGEVALLCTGRVRGLAERSPYFKEVFSFREPFFSLRTLLPNLKTALLLRKKQFDLGINLHEIGSLRGTLMMGLLFLILGPRVSVGWNKGGKGFFFSQKVSEVGEAETHETKKYLQLIVALGGEIPSSAAPELFISKEDDIEVERLLKERGILSSRMIVGLQPGGNKKEFLWPIPHFAAVAKHLRKRYDASIVVTGDGREKSLAERLQGLVDFPIINLCGLLPLERIPALLRRLHLFVSNDTGLAHLAGAVGTPLVSIFGPCSEKRFYPFLRDGKGLVIHRKDVSRISEISNQEVTQKIDQFLGGNG